MCCGLFGGVHDFIITGILTTISDIIAHGTVQQAVVLLHHSNLAAQAVLGNMADILSTNRYLLRSQIIVPQRQFQKGQFTHPLAPNQTNFSLRFDRQVKAVKPAFVATVMMHQIANLNFGA